MGGSQIHAGGAPEGRDRSLPINLKSLESCASLTPSASTRGQIAPLLGAHLGGLFTPLIESGGVQVQDPWREAHRWFAQLSRWGDKVLAKNVVNHVTPSGLTVFEHLITCGASSELVRAGIALGADLKRALCLQLPHVGRVSNLEVLHLAVATRNLAALEELVNQKDRESESKRGYDPLCCVYGQPTPVSDFRIFTLLGPLTAARLLAYSRHHSSFVTQALQTGDSGALDYLSGVFEHRDAKFSEFLRSMAKLAEDPTSEACARAIYDLTRGRTWQEVVSRIDSTPHRELLGSVAEWLESTPSVVMQHNLRILSTSLPPGEVTSREAFFLALLGRPQASFDEVQSVLGILSQEIGVELNSLQPHVRQTLAPVGHLSHLWPILEFDAEPIIDGASILEHGGFTRHHSLLDDRSTFVRIVKDGESPVLVSLSKSEIKIHHTRHGVLVIPQRGEEVLSLEKSSLTPSRILWSSTSGHRVFRPLLSPSVLTQPSELCSAGLVASIGLDAIREYANWKFGTTPQKAIHHALGVDLMFGGYNSPGYHFVLQGMQRHLAQEHHQGYELAFFRGDRAPTSALDYEIQPGVRRKGVPITPEVVSTLALLPQGVWNHHDLQRLNLQPLLQQAGFDAGGWLAVIRSDSQLLND